MEIPQYTDGSGIPRAGMKLQHFLQAASQSMTGLKALTALQWKAVEEVIRENFLVLGSTFCTLDHKAEPSSCISNYFIAILILPARLNKQVKALFNQRIFRNRKGEPHGGKKLFHSQLFANIFKVRWGEAYMLAFITRYDVRCSLRTSAGLAHHFPLFFFFLI